MLSRARGSSAGIIITFGKYVFVVTPEVSHPRRGPGSSAFAGMGLVVTGVEHSGAVLHHPSPDLALSLVAGVPFGEKEGDEKHGRTRTPCAVDGRARSRVNLFLNASRSRPQWYETSIAPSGRGGLIVVS